MTEFIAQVYDSLLQEIKERFPLAIKGNVATEIVIYSSSHLYVDIIIHDSLDDYQFIVNFWDLSIKNLNLGHQRFAPQRLIKLNDPNCISELFDLIEKHFAGKLTDGV